MIVSRLAPAAKSVVGLGYEYAVRDRAGVIGEEHLLEALLADAEGSRLLGGASVEASLLQEVLAELAESRRKAGLTAAEEAALAGLGIDVDAVIGQIEDQLGSQALVADVPARAHWWQKPVLSREAARVLAEAERHLSATQGRSLGVEHLVLGLVSVPGVLSESLARRGIDEASVRVALAAESPRGAPQ